MNQSPRRSMCCATTLLAWLLIFGAASQTGADIRLPWMVSSGMVLQRDVPVRIWGWAGMDEKITVSIGGQTVSASSVSGTWVARLAPMKAGGPFVLTIKGENTIEIPNVLVGEVWLCSGQSNMGMVVADVIEARKEIASANDSLLRMFTIPLASHQEPQADIVRGVWRSTTPRSVRSFSATAYFYGRKLREELGVPVGLITSAWPGTMAEAWAPVWALDKWEKDAYSSEMHKELLADREKQRKAFALSAREWKAAGSPGGLFMDPGVPDSAKNWMKPDEDSTVWKEIAVPGVIDTLVPDLRIDGGVWFRRTISIPDQWAGKQLRLSLGTVDDFDTTYFNGVRIGYTADETPNAWNVLRYYTVPGKLVRKGTNTLVVRLWDHKGGGGFYRPADSIRLELNDKERIPLAGTWRYRIEQWRVQSPELLGDPDFRASLYNAMIAPLTPYAIKGAIWYQGESNADGASGPSKYASLLSSLITSWRSSFDSGEFPFYIVQLPNFRDPLPYPAESPWAQLRQAQYEATTSVPNAALSINIDIGEAANIHPRNKQEIGHRLAILALARTYGRKLAHSGPIVKSVRTKGNKAVVAFDHADAGLATSDKKSPKGFAVAGTDGKFQWAKASIVKKTVVVSSPEVKKIAKVRYAWADNPQCNLVNKDGLPAMPFEKQVGGK